MNGIWTGYSVALEQVLYLMAEYKDLYSRLFSLVSFLLLMQYQLLEKFLRDRRDTKTVIQARETIKRLYYTMNCL
jgi:hypothetical protein